MQRRDLQFAIDVKSEKGKAIANFTLLIAD